MPTSVNVTNLKINELTEAQYDSAVQGGVIGENELSILTDVDAGQLIQVATLPTASADELGNIYQFVGTTDANYTNGYFYKCVSDGQTPAVYSWSRVDVQPGGLVNTATGIEGLTISGTASADNYATNVGALSSASNSGASIGWGAESRTFGVACGAKAKATGSGSVSIGYESIANGNSAVCLGGGGAKATGFQSTALGAGARATASRAIQIGDSTNSDANTFKVANANGNYEMMSADGSIPSDRLVHAINKYSTMPTAANTNEGWIVQFTGTTDSTYTHGHLYECVSDGSDPATYSWTEVSMGGSSLPSQTGNAGKFLTTDGTDASWSDKPLVNASSNSTGISIRGATGSSESVFIGDYSGGLACNYSVYIGRASAPAGGAGHHNVAVGYNAKTATNAYGCVQLGSGTCGNGEFCVALSPSFGANPVNYTVMKSDGTIPTARLTKVNSTITLTAADWSSNTQTVNVTGMTANGVVFVSPDPTDQSAYTSAGILCTAQAAGTLTFTCSTTPSADIDVNVVML